MASHKDSAGNSGVNPEFDLRTWMINVNENLDKPSTYDSSKSWKIHKVPENLRKVYESAFIPKIVSIGPLTYWQRKWRRHQAMEEHKMRFLVSLLGRTSHGQSSHGELTMEGGREESVGDGKEDAGRVSRSVLLEQLVTAMTELEDKARAYYSEKFDNIDGDHFIRMLVLDGCFIIQLMLLYHEQVHGGENVEDPIFTTRWMLRTLQRDLLMLENQLPFIVLEKLYTLIKQADPKVASVPLDKLAVTFFNPLLPRSDPTSKLNSKSPYAHLLDIFRSTFLGSVGKVTNCKGPDQKIRQSKPDRVKPHVQLIHNAWELQELGVKLHKGTHSDLLDIVFNEDTLQIPPLSINDDTVPILLNFVAYEQCDEQPKPLFTEECSKIVLNFKII